MVVAAAAALVVVGGGEGGGGRRRRRSKRRRRKKKKEVELYRLHMGSNSRLPTQAMMDSLAQNIVLVSTRWAPADALTSARTA